MKTDNVIVKKSGIEGKGVFAWRDFKKGETVLRWNTDHKLTKEEAARASEVEKNYISCLDGQYVAMQEPEKFVNHSCNANTTAKNSSDVAIRDIKKGEEITADYSEEMSPGVEMKCKCGSNDCRKIIKRCEYFEEDK